jgi:type VI secretion system protein VasD
MDEPADRISGGNLFHNQRRVQTREGDAVTIPVSSRRRLILTGCLLLLVGLSPGCGKKPEIKQEKPPPKLSLKIVAAADANRGPGGKALPIVVRVYDLKGQGAFTTADFFSLYDRESAVLGSALLARDEVTLAPGQFLPIERQLNPDATYLGVIAAFRDIDHSHWREPLRLNPGLDNKVLIEVGANSVSIRHQ